MNKQDFKPLRDILQDSLRDLKIDDKIQESRILEAWPEIVGSMLASHTLSTKIIRNVLYVKLDTPILRNELQMMRQSLIERLNKVSGGQTLQDIVFR
jgi:predicted nucleic acid-binding Zn ribbon protein